MEKNQFFYQNEQLYLVFCGSESRTLLRHQGSPLAESHSQRALGQTSLLASDMQNSVLRTHGADKQSLSYDPYGHDPLANRAHSLLGFNGQSRQAVTGVYLLGNGYRAYNPILRRFCAADSWSPFGAGGLNAYMYCAGDPVNRADPSGHMFFYRPDGTGTSYPGPASFMPNVSSISPHSRIAPPPTQHQSPFTTPLSRVGLDVFENPTSAHPISVSAHSQAPAATSSGAIVSQLGSPKKHQPAPTLTPSVQPNVKPKGSSPEKLKFKPGEEKKLLDWNNTTITHSKFLNLEGTRAARAAMINARKNNQNISAAAKMVAPNLKRNELESLNNSITLKLKRIRDSK